MLTLKPGSGAIPGQEMDQTYSPATEPARNSVKQNFPTVWFKLIGNSNGNDH